MTKPVHVIGGGMAGSEAAWALAQTGVPVVLHEMRPVVVTDAHKTDGLAELVCSNSFRSDDKDQNAVGLLHEEMRMAGSLVMAVAALHQVPAGGALAVDRDGFSAEVTRRIAAHPLITIERGEVAGLPPADWDSVIVATGPLTSPSLAEAVRCLTGEADLAFFDAIAPIVHRESIDMDVAWFQSRYDKVGPGGTGKDYINCPMDKAQYEAFITALNEGDKGDFKEWEKNTPYFDGCLPIEVMAERGPETLRFGPMKPIGLTNAAQPHRQGLCRGAAAPGQCAGHALQHGGLPDEAEIRRAGAGVPHHSRAGECRVRAAGRVAPQHLPQFAQGAGWCLRLKADPRLRFAGQITGVEGYVESAAMGIMAGRMAAAERLGRPFTVPPATTAHGALLNHITGGHLLTTDGTKSSFQPMNVNFGL
jgi:methylenetetrahydrofolate--tRNA-(uracil-5-)-methyltransferase